MMQVREREAIRRSGVKVKDVMTREILKVDKDDRLEQALDLMVKKRVTKLPVLEKGKIVGIITDGEIADEIGALRSRGVAPSHVHVSGAMRREFPTVSPEQDVEDVVAICKKENVGIVPVVVDHVAVGVVTKADLLPLVKSQRPVADFMVTRLHAVDPTDRVIHARRIMIDHGVERLPVLSAGKLVGIVSELDVALGYDRLKQRISDNHQAEALKRWLVEEIMVGSVVTAGPTTTAVEAARIMREQDVGGLPIVHETGKIAGMITRTDLIRLIEI